MAVLALCYGGKLARRKVMLMLNTGVKDDRSWRGLGFFANDELNVDTAGAIYRVELDGWTLLRRDV